MLTAEKRKYTAHDYEMLEEGAPFQLINYDLIMSPSPLFLHQQIVLKFAITITNYINSRSNSGVVVLSPMDVKLDDGNIFQPDLLYISEGRKLIIKDRIDGAPDMVIEVLSPSTAYYDLRQKKRIYEQHEVLEYIIVDPIEQNGELYFLENKQYVLKQKAAKGESLHSVLLQGLSFDLGEILKLS